MEALKVETLTYSYDSSLKPVLSDISFSLNCGDSLGIIGLNGSGKTTLSYCLCGIIPHYLQGILKGKVFVNGLETSTTSLSRLTTEIGIVLQDPNIQLLMPTVEEDLAFGLENQNVPRAEIGKTIDRICALTGIGHLRKENPNRLSGGEKQLVALSTVLAMDPSIIIFDESLSMLDEQATELILTVMFKLKAEGKTLVIIDHTWKSRIVYDHAFVLEDGHIVNRGATDAIFNAHFVKKVKKK
jgi:energy-coupling factor transport system ATP-binding protein